MLSLTDLKVGKKIILNNDPWLILFSQHSKMGRAGAVLRTRLKNLKSGAITNKTFQGNEQFTPAEIIEQEAQYLYADDQSFYFMNTQTFDQFELPKKVLGDSINFLKEGLLVKIFYFNNQPINLELPIKMELEVTEAPPTIRGNTADGGSKQVTLETGLKINTPLFIKTGDKVIVNTQNNQYSGKTK